MQRRYRQIIGYAIAVISFLIAGLSAELLASNTQLGTFLIGTVSIVIFLVPVIISILWARPERGEETE